MLIVDNTQDLRKHYNLIHVANTNSKYFQPARYLTVVDKFIAIFGVKTLLESLVVVPQILVG